MGILSKSSGRIRDVLPLPQFKDGIASEALKGVSRIVRRRVVKKLGWVNWANEGISVLNELWGKAGDASEGRATEMNYAQRKQRAAICTENSMAYNVQQRVFSESNAFVFRYCAGIPDMPKFEEKERYRRKKTLR